MGRYPDHEADLQRLLIETREACVKLADLLRRIRQRCRAFEAEIDRYASGEHVTTGGWQTEN